MSVTARSRGRVHSAALLISLAVPACADRPAPAPAPSPDAEAPIVVSIVTTTDLHGHVEALPWLAGHVRALRDARERAGGAVVLVDSGDMFQGTLESNLNEGRAVVSAYNTIGYTAAAVGNHEFDYGPEGHASVASSPADNPRGAIEARAREARFPLLAANVRRAGGEAWAPRNIRGGTIVEARGVRIGLVGVTTADTPRATDPRNLVGLEIAPLAGAITTEARRLREAGATVVVVLAHAGGSCRSFDNPDDLSSCSGKLEIFEVARALPTGLVDVIAAGHTHQGVAHRVNGIAIVGAFAEGVAFGRVDLTVDRGTRRPAGVRIFPPRFVCNGSTRAAIASLDAHACTPGDYEGRPVAYDEQVASIVAPDVARADALRSRPLGVVLETPFERRGPAESSIGNLVADMIRAARPSADVGLYNRGGLRADLPPGPLTYGRLYALVPFDNTVGTIVVTAEDLGRAVVRGLQRSMPPSVSGLRGQVQCRTDGAAVIWRRQDGSPLPPGTRLTVATSSFLVSDGDGLFEGLPGTRDIEPSLLRDVVAEAFSARGGTLRADDPAIFDPARPRLEAPGTLPFRCPLSTGSMP